MNDDEVARAAALVTRLVERAARAGSTCVHAEVVAAGLRAAGVHDPAPGAEAAYEAGDVAAFAEERLLGHVEWAELEERVAEDLVRLEAAADQAVLLVDAPRGSDHGAVVGPLVAAVQSADGRVAQLRGEAVPAGMHLLAEAALVVVERADLLGLADAARLAGAVPDGARLVLCGDPALPPAPGPGRVLADLVASGVLPVLAAPETEDTDADPLALLVRSLRTGVLPALDPARREVVVTAAADARQAVHRAVQLVTSSVPRAFGVTADDILVLAPRVDGRTGAGALRTALADAEAGTVEVRTCAEAVGHPAAAVVLVLGAEAAGSLTRDLLVGAATEAGVHLSVVHQAGSALAEAVAVRPHRPRRTRLARLLTDALG